MSATGTRIRFLRNALGSCAGVANISMNTQPAATTGFPTVPVRSGGFTLLEILVVIVIVGILVSVATVAVGVLGRDREVEEQARRLWAVMTQGREEAELQGRDLGLFIEDSGYEFMTFDPKQPGWVAVEDDGLLTRRELPPGLRIRLWLEAREVVLKAPRQPTAEEQKKRLPQIIMVASGEIVPFELEIAREGSDVRWHVLSQPDNTLLVEAADAS